MSYLIFDVDDTLLDFGFAFHRAQKEIATRLGVEDLEAFRRVDEACGWRAWKECRLEETQSEEVQREYHRYYRKYLRRHYRYLAEEWDKDWDEEALADYFLEQIAGAKRLQEADTLEVYRRLSERHSLILATNGLERVQRERVSDFLPYTKRVYISEEMGTIKPAAEFYRRILQDLQCDAGECWMIGDSLSNDIRGAKAVGMQTCFYNPRRKPVPEDGTVDLVIERIGELLQIFR